MVLYVTDFITSARVATVAEIDSGSTLHDTCLITEVQKSFEKPTILHGATPAETCFAAPLHVSQGHLRVSTCNSSFIYEIALLCHVLKKTDAKPVILSAEAS